LQSFHLGPWLVTPKLNRVDRNGTICHLEPKVMQVLVCLADANGDVVSKEKILETVWPGVFVTEDGLKRCVSELRRAFGDDARNSSVIETISKGGYRLIFPVVPVIQSSTNAADEEGNQPQTKAPRGRSSRALKTSLVVVAIAVLAVAAALPRWSSRRGLHLDLQNMHISKLTESGKASHAAISPDGRYVAYTEIDGDKQSLWVRQVAMGGKVQLLPPEVVVLAFLTFSPDGNYLCFTRAGGAHARTYLYQIPALGGTPRLLAQDLDSAVSFSPDGKRFAFIRGEGLKGAYHIVVADTDGSGERILATRKTPLKFEFVGPAWSPDGKSIAASGIGVDYSKGKRWSIEVISVADGSSREIYSTESMIGRLRWLPEGKGLITVLSNVSWLQLLHAMGGQIWYVGYPAGEAHQLTNDLMNYDPCCLDLTRDASAITDVQNSAVSNLWIASATALDSPTQITSGDPVVRRQAWMPDDKTVIYQTLKGDLYSIRRDGSAATLLTDQHKVVRGPSICGDGRYVVFESSRDGSIWRMGPDGSNPTRLTDGKLDHFPECSPDGKWVLYVSEHSGRHTLWRMPIDRRESIELMQKTSYEALLSPSGRLIYYFTHEPQPRWVVISANGGKRLYSFDTPVSAGFFGPSWAPDERGLDYVSGRGGVSNIWRQPLDGGAPKQITHFTSGHIFGFAWSRNGKWLALARGETSSDVVILSDFR
jgi:Tol biopolymer transport system component/DNA-binding winged helix-turn-helix (wHTH) protein